MNFFKNRLARWVPLLFLFVLSGGSLWGDNYFDFNALPHDGYYNGSASLTITTQSNAGYTFNNAWISDSTSPSESSPVTNSTTTTINTSQLQPGWNRLQAVAANYSGTVPPTNATVVSPARYFYIGNLTYKANFQASGTTAPTGYFADNGTAYPESGNTLAPYTNPGYGWIAGNVTTSGNATTGYANMTANATWQLQLPTPAARYWVTATTGNSSATGNYTLAIEGRTLSLSANGTNSGGVEVEVSGGNLTVQNESGITVPLCHIEVTHLGRADDNGRYVRGTGYDPGFQSMVVPLDDETGSETVAVAEAYPAPASLPWFATVPYVDPANITNTSAPYHLAMTNGNISSSGSVTNGNVSYGVTIGSTQQTGLLECNQPFVSFGNTTWNGTTLFAGRTYNFGVFAGWLLDADNTTTGLAENSAIVIAAYNKTDYDNGAYANGTMSPNLTYIAIPATNHTGNDTTWQNFVSQGFSVSASANDLDTTISYLPSESDSILQDGWDVDTEYSSMWLAGGGNTTTNPAAPGQNKAHFPFLITHMAHSNDYYYVVYGIGRTGYWNGTGSYNELPMAGQSGNSTMRYEPLYGLEFAKAPAWGVSVLTLPTFNGQNGPANYGGQNLTAIAAANLTPGANFTYSGNTYLAPPIPYTSGNGNSTWTTNGEPFGNYGNLSLTWTSMMNTTTLRPPEFDDSPILDTFVAQMGNDPIALAGYVQNEIAITNPFGNGDGTLRPNLPFTYGGMDRGAIATYLEGRGSPLEQCALLIYLLRQAGYDAVYVFPPGNSTLISSQQLSSLCGVTLQSVVNATGQSYTPISSGDPAPKFQVNYPWVAVQIPNFENSGLTKWVHLGLAPIIRTVDLG